MRTHRHVVAAIAALALASAAAEALTPRESLAQSTDVLDLKALLPATFAGWSTAPDVQLVEPVEPDSLSREIYSQVAARGYKDQAGRVVMLLVAYGPSQSDRLQLHRPEICYVADGFRVSQLPQSLLPLGDALPGIPLRRLVAQRERRFEPISYWMRVGDELTNGVLDRQLVKLRYGLRGLVPDGVVVRVSTVGLPLQEAQQVQERFIRDLIGALGPAQRRHLIGT